MSDVDKLAGTADVRFLRLEYRVIYDARDEAGEHLAEIAVDAGGTPLVARGREVDSVPAKVREHAAVVLAEVRRALAGDSPIAPSPPPA